MDVSDDDNELFLEERSAIRRIRDNDPRITVLLLNGSGGDFFQNITNEEWEEIGRDISNNAHLKEINFACGELGDDKASCLFRGMTSRSSLEELCLRNNEISAAGVRTMVPFLQHADNLQQIDLDGNNLQSEGFNFLLRALRDSPIESLDCMDCDIESIEIDMNYFPRRLTCLYLADNNINADGCRGLATLLQGGDSTLTYLSLSHNKIDDEGVAILVSALRRNESLRYLGLRNDGITKEGQLMLLTLVNDISSVKATLESNHSLSKICVIDDDSTGASEDQIQIQQLVNTATNVNKNRVGNPEEAGSEKVIETQLHSEKRTELAELQGVQHSVYSEINHLHLPEVLSLVGHRHGQGELYLALKSSIAGVISTVNRRQCIQQKRDYHVAMAEQFNAELAAIDAAAGGVVEVESGECRRCKRRL